jgi:hypothetical protein
MESPDRITIPDLLDIDVLEMEEQLPEGAVQSAPAPSSDGTADYHDLGLTAAIVIVSVAAINGLSVWLAKRRSTEKDVTDITLVKDSQGGCVLKYRRSTDTSVSESPDPAVVKAIQGRLEDLLQLAQ